MTNKPDNRDRRRMLAVALGVQVESDAIQYLEGGADEADIVEMRLDFFAEAFDVGRLVRSSPVPLIVTNRPPREGGRSTLSDAERLHSLFAAADAGAAFVDLEWDVATPDVVRRIQAAGTRTIVSRHNFDTMPVNLREWPVLLGTSGADVVKVVGMAGDALDMRQVLDVLETADRPTIAIAMGNAGRASRVLALRYDSCLLTFAAPSSTAGTAPGQVSISDLRRVFHAETLNRSTAVFGVLGDPVDDHLVTELNNALQVAGVDAVAVPFPTNRPIGSIVTGFRSLPVDGWLLPSTISIADLRSIVDGYDDAAALAGVASTIVRVGGELIARNPSGGLLGVMRDWTGTLDGRGTNAKPRTTVPRG